MDLTRDVYPLNDTGTPQTCGDEREWSETFAQKSGTTAHLLCSLSTCITVLSYNIFAILLGHVALRNMPIYPSLSHTFVDTDLITTLSLAVLGSSVLTIPLFIAITLTFDGAAVHAVGSSAMRRAEAVVPRDILRPVSPRVHALLWEVWMISAAPMGSLLWDAIFLDLNPESYLDSPARYRAGSSDQTLLCVCREALAGRTGGLDIVVCHRYW
ncbi:hypothetical protein L226DRAFT_184423 [Lentinus tigrinus ALCF2SS1-7]|uniref:uncharacterized protein n=1 Tax=Lentinus tigrinus ALCF2SS1-7 TaxID=1328758 RepID=UPI001165D5E9|nr:hypothetical protein L226DRAFT_184423 [Lentinus tigrinus ALCF2SS1-7]